MKKIDFHIHTVPTISESYFTFCMDTLEQYVSVSKLDAIAITNHDIFDLDQFFPHLGPDQISLVIITISGTAKILDEKDRLEIVDDDLVTRPAFFLTEGNKMKAGFSR